MMLYDILALTYTESTAIDEKDLGRFTRVGDSHL